MSLSRVPWWLFPLATAPACVPRESPDDSSPEAYQLVTPPALTAWRPRPRPKTTLGGREASAEVSPASDPMIEGAYEDDFEREDLGPDWLATGGRWQLRDGRLCGQSALNHPLWLKRRLPTNARISFTARSLTDSGDIKVEAWGHGRSFARGQSYNDATSYLFVFGGWHNRLHVLARLNEHGKDRKELTLDAESNDLARRPVAALSDYHFVISRGDGKTVTWESSDTLLLTFEDASPLKGLGHDHFAFNNWESEVCFDDLIIVPLE